MIDYNELTIVARKLALEAGAKIMEIYASDDFDVKVKSDESPVTIADEAADLLVVTEEQAATHEMQGETFLIVDPLDGTKEFIQRRGDFTVNIALVESGTPTRGVVYAPARKRMFFTTADGTSVEESGEFALHEIGATKLGRTREWDTAAGHAVLKGAGGEVVRFDDHTPLRYGKAGYANPFFIAYTPDVQLRKA